MYRLLTLGHDLAEERLPTGEGGRGAVPATVPELVLALVDGCPGALGHGYQDPRVVTDQAPLLPAQDVADRWIQVVVRQGVGLDVVADEVVGLGDLGDPPGIDN